MNLGCISLLVNDASWNTYWLSVNTSHGFSELKGLWFVCTFVFDKQRIPSKFLFVCLYKTGHGILRTYVQILEYLKIIIWCLHNDEHSETWRYVTSQFVVLFATEVLSHVLLRFLMYTLCTKSLTLPSEKKTVVNIGHIVDYTAMVLWKKKIRHTGQKRKCM